MISGDIDLTEKLDFYRDKEDKKKNNSTALIPWTSREIEEVKEKYDNCAVSITNGYYNTWTSLSYSASTRSYGNNTIYINDNSSYSTISTSNYTINYNTNVTWYDTDVSDYNTTNEMVVRIAFNDGVNYCSIDTTDSMLTGIDYINPVEWVNAKSKHTIELPEKRKRRSVSSDLPLRTCYNCGKEYIGFIRCKCRKSEYDKETAKFIELCENSDKRKKYKRRELEVHSERVEGFLSNKLKYRKIKERALRHFFDPDYKENRIPWLKHLSTRIYEDYIRDLFEEQDYSSYLTNMNWLRISK